MIDETAANDSESAAARVGTGAMLVNIFTSPGEAFAALAARPTVLVPILALVLGNAAVIMWYYGEVDVRWLLQYSLEASGAQLPPDADLDALGGMSPAVAGGFGVASYAIRTLGLLLLGAAYLSAVSMFTNDGVTYRRWLSLVAWSSMPGLAAVLSSAVNLALNDATFMPPTEINLLSIGNVLGIDAMGGGWLRTALLSVSATSLWAIALAVVGYRLWTGKSFAASIVIVAGPPAVLVALALPAVL